jgi:hypothetical protein
MLLEREILFHIRNEYIRFLEEHKHIYQNTLKYKKIKQIATQNAQRLKSLEEELDTYMIRHENFKGRIIGDLDYYRTLDDERFLLQEDMKGYIEMLQKLYQSVDTGVYQRYLEHETDVRRFTNMIDKIDQFNS